MDQSIKKGVELAEKELQEKEVERIKLIAKSYLEKINEKTKEKAKIDSEIKDLKKDLDDLKSGRLDKIEERQALDPVAKSHSLVIIKKIVEHYYPSKPWYSQYEIRCVTPTITITSDPSILPFSTYTTSSGTNTVNTMYYSSNASTGDISTLSVTGPSSGSFNGAFNAIGTSFQNFIGGTYKLGSGDIVNL